MNIKQQSHDIKEHYFLYIEYGNFDHFKRIAFLVSMILLSIFLQVYIDFVLYQCITGYIISNKGVFGILSVEGMRKRHLLVVFGPFIIIILLIAIPMLLRSILITGDIYLCNDNIYIKRILFRNKFKIIPYSSVQFRYWAGAKKIFLIYKIFENKKIHYSYLLLSSFIFRITKEKNSYNMYPEKYDINQIISLLASRNIDVEHIPY